MNRADRRRRGIRRATTSVGAGLLLTTGLFGAYVGNPRLPSAYAATLCGGAAVTTETELNAAIVAFNGLTACDTIELGADITLSADLTVVYPSLVDSTLTVDGNGHTINGAKHTGFTNNFSALKSLTLQDIGLSAFTLAAYVQGTTLNVQNSLITGSNAGGQTSTLIPIGLAPVSVYGGTLNVTRSTFTGNSDDFGSGALVVLSEGSGGTLTVTDSYFTDNGSYYDAGAIHVDAGAATVTISGSTFSNNHSAAGAGGAVNVADGTTLSIVNSTFTVNGASESGGAIATSNGATTITDSTFIGNSASIVGGGISNGSGDLTITNSVFNNTAGSRSDIVSSSTPAVTYSFVTDADWGDGYLPFIGDGAGGDTSHNIKGTDPGLGTLGDNGGFTLPDPAGTDPTVDTITIPTMLPADTSPVIDAGNDGTGGPSTDERGTGFDRVVNSKVDMGAVELQSGSESYTVTAGTATGGSATATDNGDGTWSLAATPSAGYTFSSWSCDASQTPASTSSASTTITPTADTTCTPTFTAITVTAGTATGGSATATDNGGGTWSLTATPSSGYTFSGWSCDALQTPASTSASSTTITPTASTTCTPAFTAVPLGIITETNQTVSSVFINNTASPLATAQYSVQTTKGKTTINGVNPGVLFYWAQFHSTGTGTQTLVTETPSNAAYLMAYVSSGSNIYKAGTTTVAKGYKMTWNSGTLTVSGLPTGDYWIGVKFSASSLAGKIAPSPASVTYGFKAGNDASSSQTLTLNKKS